jgi:hypothetical protein
MPKADVGLASGGLVGRISFDTQNIHAIGGPDFPKLIFTLEMRLSPFRGNRPGDQSEQLHPLTWMSLSGEFFSPEQRAVSQFRDDVNVYADGSYSLETQFRLEIPLNQMALERIERARDGNLRAALRFDGFIAVHGPKGGCIERFERTRIETMSFMIPKSQWVEQLLPQLGYGTLELIEVRMSNGVRAEGLPKAVAEIREARKYLVDGDWDKAVAHCRNTLETILNSRQLQVPATSAFRMKVDEFVRDHLSSRLGEKQSKLLAEEMKLLWEVCSQAAHPTPADSFHRDDANFILRNTTAIVELVSRLLA